MLLKCTRCGKPIGKFWLFLGLPWSKYVCRECGARYAGTFLRTVIMAVTIGVLGYVTIGAIKSRINPLYVIPILLLTLVLMFCNLPRQLKRIDREQK